MAYDGISKRVKDALKQLLTEQQVDGHPAFSAVLDSTRGEFASYPAVRVLPADVTNTQAATAENDRVQQFTVRVTLPLENNPAGEAATIDRMYDLTDLIIDTIESGDHLGRMSQIDPTVEVLIMTASRGDWSKDQSKVGLIMMCDVAVSVTYSREF